MNENGIPEDWTYKEWTQKAYQLLNGISKFPKEGKIILLIRHSQRYHSGNIRTDSKDLLTPLGHKYAKLFGRYLPQNRPIRLFHSKIERCKQTAENIINGFNHHAESAELIGSLDVLYDINITPENFYREATKYSWDRLLYRWAAGLYPPEIIPPLQEYAKKSADIIWNQLENAPPKTLDIHITHDLILLILRLGWFGLPLEAWPWYLTGFAFTFEDDEISLYDFNQLKSIEIPYWWK
jgi:broad specificity phosphatase PhoE